MTHPLDEGLRYASGKRPGPYADKTPREVTAFRRACDGAVLIYDIIGNPKDFPGQRGNGVVYMTEDEWRDMVQALRLETDE